MQTSARIVGKNVVLVVRGLESLPSRILQAASIGLSRGLQIAAGVAQKSYLTGPRPARLGVRSGRLRGAVTSSVETRVSDGGVVGRLSNNVAYAGFHEFGFHGQVNVSAHTRVLENIGEFGDDLDGRRLWKERGGRVIGYRDTRKQASSRMKHFADTVQFVRAHTRNISYDGRPFLRPALVESQPVILRELKRELAGLTPATN